MVSEPLTPRCKSRCAIGRASHPYFALTEKMLDDLENIHGHLDEIDAIREELKPRRQTQGERDE